MQDESFNFRTSFTDKKAATTSKPAMSLYHEAAGILDTVNKGKTSLKAEIFGKKTWKTDGKTLFALTSEAAKWSSILAEVVEKSGILKLEKVRSPA
jgi:putative methyltransferase